MKAPKISLLFVITGLLFVYSCNSQNTKTTTANNADEEPPSGSFNANSGIKFDSASIEKFLAEKPLFKEFSKQFDTFYRNNNFNYVWYDSKGLIETSSLLIASIDNIDQQGVTATVPYKDTLEQLLHSATDSSNIVAPDINTELMLTGEYFFYAKKIWEGDLNNKAESINWYIPRKKLSYTQLLDSNLRSGTITPANTGEIVISQYAGLKKALAQYREIEKKGNEITVPLLKGSSVVKPNTSSPVIIDIRKRLNQLGYTASTDTSNLYDSVLASVVEQAKPAYGLPGDSKINNAFINAINIPAKKREVQIMVNMERLRWIPEDTSANKEFILVNIPEYTLVYYENGSPVWRCGVVVGKPMTRTVIFSGDMRYVVFSPYWNIPRSIINKEVIPGMRKNKNYLARHNMEWNGGNVRQKPGPANSLGLVKFLFPNSNNIYLHDTPSKSLFNETSRAFSHGCVRVAKPRDLAIRILRQYPEWTPDKIDAAMHAGKEKYVTLKQTIPVYIGYFTAFVGEDEQLNFRPDIYNRDDRLFNMLTQN